MRTVVVPYVRKTRKWIPKIRRERDAESSASVRAIVNRITIKWPCFPRCPFEHTSGQRHRRTIVLRQRNELPLRFTVASFIPRETAPKIVPREGGGRGRGRERERTARRCSCCFRDEWQYRGRILWSAIKVSAPARASAACSRQISFTLGGAFLSL